jgi:hypothetical protein
MKKIIEMDSWGKFSNNENILSFNFFGCICIIIQTKEKNILFHISADNKELINLAKEYSGKYINSKIVQYIPLGMERVDIIGETMIYDPIMYLKNGDAKLLFRSSNKISLNDCNKEKTLNYIGIIENRIIISENLKIN